MHCPRCEPQRIYIQTYWILCSNKFFFLARDFGGRHDLMYKNENHLFGYLLPIVRFSNYFCQHLPYKSESCLTLSLE